MTGKLPATPSQTVGPFFQDCMLRADATFAQLAGAATAGERIRIEGHVYDGDTKPVPDAMLEVWQANHYGRYNHPADTSPGPLDAAFPGYGRIGTDHDGAFRFETIRPGAVRFNVLRMQAPHFNVAIFARGLLNHLLTRIYLEGDDANNHDPVLSGVREDRRGTLIAEHLRGGDIPTYRFDIVLQGKDETVFFDYYGVA